MAWGRQATRIRIFNGAVLPKGADRVIMQEDVQTGNGTIVSSFEVKPKRDIHQPGEEL